MPHGRLHLGPTLLLCGICPSFELFDLILLALEEVLLENVRLKDSLLVQLVLEYQFRYDLFTELELVDTDLKVFSC